MKKGKVAYCPFCNSFEEFSAHSEKYVADVRGEKIFSVRHVAHCKKCHNEIFVRELVDEDQRILFEEYKKRTGLLTAEEIREFRKRYGLSAVNFALLLGLGEKTITRIEGGDIQSKSVDVALRLAMTGDNIEWLAEEAGIEIKSERYQGWSFFHPAPKERFREFAVDALKSEKYHSYKNVVKQGENHNGTQACSPCA